MKKLIFIFLLFFISFTSEAQVKKLIDTTQMCIPYDIAQKMLLDLNDYDRLKEISKLDKQEIKQLNDKIVYLEKTNQAWEVRDSLSTKIVAETEEKVKIYEEENKNLGKEVKRLKTKNTLFSIIAGAIITPLTYIAVFK